MPTMLVRPAERGGLAGAAGNPLPGQPRPAAPLRPADRLRRRPRGASPEDEGYLQDALERVKALNERYGEDGAEKFFLFHRRRLWNPVQGCWMGWERKRGKLAEFNRLLRGATATRATSVLSGDPATLPAIRFVITLDADTQLPRDGARRLVGTLAHPLNRPRFDPEQGRVVEGYGVLQPRVSFHLTAATQSRFAGLLAASAGIDPYSTAVSDIYMDLFGVGSFTGKGIYDVDAFEAATGRAFPENHILSHDLIEGNYARCGLVTDIELFDDFPAALPRLRPPRAPLGPRRLAAPALAGPARARPRRAFAPNPLPALERWKIFDNLRRSLVPPALVVLLALGWTVLPGSPWLWTAAALAVPALPLVQLLIGTLVTARSVRHAGGLAVVAWIGMPAATGQALLAIVVPGRPGAARRSTRSCGRWRGSSSRAGTCWSGRPRPSTERRLGDRPRATSSRTCGPRSVLAVAPGGRGRAGPPRGPGGGLARCSPPGSSRRSSPTGSAGRGRSPSPR